MTGSINILIVHYNTPYLTECLIRSINKFTPNSIIYVFDNSDKLPFKNDTFENVIKFDNTDGKYINFEEWLKQYPKRTSSPGKVNGWGSAKHCVSVEKCMSLIGKNFILLDSDVLLKKDISDIYDPGCIYVGEVVTQPKSVIKRVLPYICFINVEECKHNGIHYFDDSRMHGLRNTDARRDADNYDTGAAFYINCGELNKREIKVEDYVIHYSGASWNETKEKKINHVFNPKQWTEHYGKLWKTDEELEMSKNRNVIYTCITGNYEPLDDPMKISEGFDYICFTNSNLKSDIWEMRPIPEELNDLSEVKKQRCIKINPQRYLPEYDLSVWVDGSIKLLKDINEFISGNCSDVESIYIPKHPSRNCIYKEMETCIKLRKDKESNIAPQREKYKEEGYPENYGLVQSNIIIRRHNEPDCIKLMETWWYELKNGSHRDQLSFNYAMWRNPEVQVKFLDKNTCNSEYFKWDKMHGKSSNTSRPASPTNKFTVHVVPAAMKKHYKPATSPAKKKIVTTNPVVRKKIIAERIHQFAMA